MAQLTSPPLSARRLANWLIEKFRHPTKPLSSVSLLLSEKEPKPFVAPNGAESAVETANADNVTAAIKDWFNRANTDFQNLMLFFFCGHGISAGTETALLMSDYGADPLSALDGAINFRLLRLATQQCRATEQCFIVDACRASSDTLVSAEFAGRVVIQARPRIPTWPPRRFPVFYASSKGDKAYGFPDQPTAYTNALLKTLDHFGGDDEEGDWRVGTHRLAESVEHLVSRQMANDHQKVQVPTSDDQTKIHLHYMNGPPEALVYVASEPPDALRDATLQYQLAGGAPTSAPLSGRKESEWELQLATGRYNFIATFPGGVSRIDSHVRPAYRRIKLPVAGP